MKHAARPAGLRGNGPGIRPVSTAADTPLTDLEDLFSQARGAVVVGLGASCRAAHELWALEHRVLVHLVESGGFRSLALEEDWTLCLELDQFVSEGVGDIHEIMAGARSLWATEELLHTLRWIRARNEKHPDDLVHVFGLNADSTRAIAYSDVARYADAAADPAHRQQIGQALESLHPGDGIAAHIWRYRSMEPEARVRLLRTAHRLEALVGQVGPHVLRPHAVRQCAAITDFYEYHDRAPAEVLAYAAPRMARNLISWHESTGHKIVYWGGIAHTLTAATRTLSSPALSQRSTGSWLREHFAHSYVSIGLTFGCGHVPQPVARPSAELSEHALDLLAEADCFAVPRGALPARPAVLRIVGPDYSAESDPGCVMTGAALDEWFDLIVYTRRVTATSPLHAGSPASVERNWKDRLERS